MKVRAVIFDIYNTLLEVGPAPVDGEDRWEELGRSMGEREPMSLQEFDERSREAIAAENNEARGLGVAVPEVYWPDIARGVLPILARRTERELDDFLYKHAQLERSVRMAPGAAAVLQEIVERKLVRGICSNCQPYTLRELADALSGVGLSPELFDPELCFYSFVARFSKPDPGAFAMLTAALHKRQILPDETLMVGDRLDNDILPARAHGWRTWLISSNSPGETGGNWGDLLKFLRHVRYKLCRAELDSFPEQVGQTGGKFSTGD